MHSTSRAPELSATRSRVSCWIMPWSLRLPGPLEHFDHTPPLLARHGSSLLDAHAVALANLVALVVRVQPVGALERLAVARVTHAVDDADDDGLLHLRRDDDALAHLAGVRAGRRRGVGLISHVRAPSR